jgi:hypothetical protein
MLRPGREKQRRLSALSGRMEFMAPTRRRARPDANDTPED